MSDFKHGGDVYAAARRLGLPISAILDFSANINPYGLNMQKLKALASDADLFVHYPDPHYIALRKVLEKRYGHPAEDYLLGNGGIELIYRCLQALKPKRVGILAPTFVEYERAALGVDAEVRVLDTTIHSFKPPIETIVDFARSVDVLFICNPNNPTGTLYETSELTALMDGSPGTHLIIDEAFMEFVVASERYTMMDFLTSHENLTIIRSMTKIFSIPGLRLGFMLTGNHALKERMRLLTNPWNINSYVAAYIDSLLTSEPPWQFDPESLRPLRDQLIQGLEAIPGMVVQPSETNYIFFQFKGNFDLSSALYPQGILIRDCDNYRCLTKGAYRVAVKTAEENLRLISAINRCLKENQHD